MESAGTQGLERAGGRAWRGLAGRQRRPRRSRRRALSAPARAVPGQAQAGVWRSARPPTLPTSHRPRTPLTRFVVSPPPFHLSQIITLDMGLLVAGTKYRGEFEERLKKLMEEIKQNDQIILMIDEVRIRA